MPLVATHPAHLVFSIVFFLKLCERDVPVVAQVRVVARRVVAASQGTEPFLGGAVAGCRAPGGLVDLVAAVALNGGVDFGLE